MNWLKCLLLAIQALFLRPEPGPCANCGLSYDDEDGNRMCPVCKRRYKSLGGAI